MIFLSVLFLLLLPVGFFPSVCGLYADRVYPYLAESIGAVTAAIPFPLGEILMVLASAALILALAALLILLFFRKKSRIIKVCEGYLSGCLILLLLCGIVYELNWFLVLRSSLLGRGSVIEETFTLEQLQTLRGAFASKINALAEEVERDETGEL